VERITIIPQTTTEGAELKNGAYRYQIDGLYINLGETYVVEWDGVKYVCTCDNSLNTSIYTIGNLSIGKASAVDTGEPFLILGYTQYGYTLVLTKIEGVHTVAVYQEVEVV
jgi:hypothetical protein